MKLICDYSDRYKHSHTPLTSNYTPDNVILRAIRYDVGTLPRIEGFYNTPVRSGNILFDCYAHSTGNSLRIYVTSEDESEALMVQSVTYWHSSNYTFNPCHIIPGAWDSAIAKALDTLRAETDLVAESQKLANERRAEVESQKQAERNAKFENVFARTA